MTSLSVLVQWVSCQRITSSSSSSASPVVSRITSTFSDSARCCRTVILLAVRPSMINRKRVGLQNFLMMFPDKEILCAAHSLPCPKKGRLPNSRPWLIVRVEGLHPVLTNFVLAWYWIEKFDGRSSHGLRPTRRYLSSTPIPVVLD